MRTRTLHNPAVRGALSAAAVACIAFGLEAVTSASAQDAGYKGGPYVGIGAGVSRLEPASRSDALVVADEASGGVHVLAGYDITRWLSAEVYFADLGSAGIEFLGDDAGDVDYQVYGLNALGYLYNSRSGFGFGGDGRRVGLSLYVSLGVGGMSNDSELDYRQDYGTHASFAGGLEYGFGNGVALRAELASFDSDAQYASLSVLKRFGTRGDAGSRRAKQPAADTSPAPVAAVTPTDRTGSLPDGPTFFRPIVPPYIYFGFDSTDLTAASKAKLDAFVDEVRDSTFAIAVDGHADRQGPEAYNTTLSERRSRVVYEYLLAAGIEATRMEARSFGEKRPVSSNATVEGRSQNRRTEFQLR